MTEGRPLTPAQRGIWAGHRLAADAALYNTAERMVFAGRVDARVLEAALRRVVAECESLAAHYRDGADMRGERVVAPLPSTLLTASRSVSEPFALEREIPCRFSLLRESDHDVLLMTAHHIALDGYGYSLFWDRLAHVYGALAARVEPSPCSFASIADIIAETPDDGAAGTFWATRLGDFDPPLLGQDDGILRHGYERAERMAPAEPDACLAAMALLVHARTGARAITLGLPVMNRLGSKAIRVPCMHMNVVPLRIEVDAGDDVAALIPKIATEKRLQRKHLHYRHEQMLRDLRRDAPRERVFGPVVNVLPFPQSWKFGDLTAQKEIVCAGPVADVALNVHLGAGAAPARLEMTARFPCEGLLDEFVQALGGKKNAPKAASSVVAAVEARVKAHPEKIAVEHAGGYLTYGALWDAVCVRAANLTSEAFIEVEGLRTPETILMMLAVMKSGATYVPADPKQPAARRAAFREAIAAEGPYVRSDLAPAYVLFTSGSTGRPKGIAIGAPALAHFTAAAAARYGVTSRDRILQFAPLAFDTSLEEVFLALTTGATLVLRDDAMLDSFAAFSDGVELHHITVLDLPTAYWHEWVEALATGQATLPTSLRTVILGGEAVLPTKLRSWFAAGGARVRLINSYGPTETTIVATTADLTPAHANASFAPIGTPLPGVRTLVLDAEGRPAREGELVILGPTVGLRYLGGIALRTTVDQLPAYRTGDRVRRGPSGLEFLGRLDDELKISGHRVHPHEVESSLLRIPGIAEACVLGIGTASGPRHLAAFIAARTPLAADEIRRTLRSELPEPMVPTIVELLDALPKTPTGKVDRSALATRVSARSVPASTTAQSHTPSDLTTIVTNIWSSVIGHPNIAANDNFYDVGGQSLQAIQIAQRLSTALGRHVSVVDVLRTPTLGALCASLSSTKPSTSPVLHAFVGLAASAAQLGPLAAALGGHMRVEAHELALPFTVAPLADRLGQTEGPIHLAGHSFGGCLAFELARALEARGHRVELWLLDAYLQLDRKDDARLPDAVRPHVLGYTPSGSFDGRVHLCYARDHARAPYGTAALAACRTRDLALFNAKRRHVHDLDGDHHSLLAPHHVAPLAALIARSAAGDARP